jgi:hypothetical protein
VNPTSSVLKRMSAPAPFCTPAQDGLELIDKFRRAVDGLTEPEGWN